MLLTRTTLNVQPGFSVGRSLECPLRFSSLRQVADYQNLRWLCWEGNGGDCWGMGGVRGLACILL